ncbi:MAPEG family protein [Thorsellia kenyensis]|uniref:MAPEG family protein n=1 Tax=Thorsellia kenyensis TaxID=1549888 RepID=A0ABV6C8W7_9GAMM
MWYLSVPFLLAGIMHIFCAGIAKYGRKDFDNHHPRQWMSKFDGYRARANAAQANTLESLPFFYASALFALYMQVDYQGLACLLWIWIICRVVYIYAYIKDMATFRSIVWFVALCVNITLLFSASFFPAL